MVATDSYRLSVKHTELEQPVPQPLEANVPARALRELARIVARSDRRGRDRAVRATRSLFRAGGVVLSSRLIEGQFPSSPPADPGVVRARGEAAPGELLEVARRISQLAQRNAPLAPRLRRGRADRGGRDAGGGRRQRGDAGAVQRRAAGDRVQPAVPDRRDRERRGRGARAAAQLPAAARAAAPRRSARTSATS